jgi:hypothetical protein
MKVDLSEMATQEGAFKKSRRLTPSVALLMLTAGSVHANDEQFSLVCQLVKSPNAAPIVFDVDLRVGTVKSPGGVVPYTRPPKAAISEREISLREDYLNGWSMTIIDRYTGDGTVFMASKPDAASSDEAVPIHCVKTPGKLF